MADGLPRLTTCASAGSPKEEYETQYKRSRAMLENKEYVYTEHSTIKSATGKRMVYNKVVRCKSTDGSCFRTRLNPRASQLWSTSLVCQFSLSWR